MRKIFCSIIATCVAIAGLAEAGTPIGGNLTMGEDSGAPVFLNLFRQMRAWQTRNGDGACFADENGNCLWDSGQAAKMPVDDHGWPKAIPFDPGGGLKPQTAHSQIATRGAGTYRLLVKGRGLLRFTADSGVLNPANEFLQSVSFAPTGGSGSFSLVINNDARVPIFFELLQSDAADPIRDLQLLPPGVVGEDGPTGAFTGLYLDSVRNFRVLRFMDLGRINGSQQARWADRATPDLYTQLGPGGLAFEWMAELANRVERSPWICVPHLADDDYVRNLARLLRDRVAPQLKVFLEYSNETWNYQFAQTDYIQKTGRALGLAPADCPDGACDYLAGQRFMARRSAEIWAIFEEEFGPTADRLVKVMASQAAGTEVSRDRLTALLDPVLNPRGIRPDVLAIAPYFGGAVGDQLGAAGRFTDVTVEEILDLAAADLRNEVPKWMEAQGQLAAQHGLWLVNYEAGQHLVYNGDRSLPQAQALSDRLIAANRHPRMGGLYGEYLTQQATSGVAVNLLYHHVGQPASYGSWGLLESLAQDPAAAPKWSAMLAWIATNPPANLPPRAQAGDSRQLVAETGAEAVSVRLDGRASRDIDGRVVRFVWHEAGRELATTAESTVNLPLGRHELTLQVEDDAGAKSSASVTIVVAPAAAGQTLLEPDFAGTDPALNLPWRPVRQLDANATYSGLRVGPGVTPVAGSDRFQFWAGLNGTGAIVPFTDAVKFGDYLTFTVQAKPGTLLDLRGAPMVLRYRRLSQHASRQWALLTSVGGFSAGKEVFVSPANETTDLSQDLSFTLPFEGYSGLSQPVEFRLYLFGGQFHHNHHIALEALRLGGAAVAPTADLPPLKIQPVEEDHFQLSWPGGPYRLQFRDAVVGPSDWLPDAVAPDIVDGLSLRRFPTDATARFFRLVPSSP